MTLQLNFQIAEEKVAQRNDAIGSGSSSKTGSLPAQGLSKLVLTCIFFHLGHQVLRGSRSSLNHSLPKGQHFWLASITS